MPTPWNTNPRTIQLVRMDLSPFHSTSWPFGGRDDGGGEIEAWQLESGLYMPRKNNMQLVAPRPDGERTSNSAYSWAHPEVQYRRPIAVALGAWPYRYEIINAPSGAAIGNVLTWNLSAQRYEVPSDYGVITWQPSLSDDGQTFAFHVRVFDQDYNRAINPSAYIDVQWSVTVQASKFVFLDPAAASSGSGTIDSPLKNWMDLYIDATDATYQGNLTYSFGGTFESGANLGRNEFDDLKPRALMAVPGEVPIFPNFRMDVGTGSHDLFISGITIDGVRNETGNHYMHKVFGNTDRIMFFENSYLNFVGIPDNIEDGNPAAIMARHPNPGTNRQYFGVIRNYFNDFTEGSTNGVGAFIVYENANSVYEFNEAENMGGFSVFLLKTRHFRSSLRANVAVNNIAAGRGSLSTFSQPKPDLTDQDICGEVEICWNRTRGHIQLIDDAESTAAFTNGNQNYIYRNSADSGLNAHENHRTLTQWVVQDNMLRNGLPSSVPAWTTDNNIIAGPSSFNNNAYLVNESRKHHLGLAGSESVEEVAKGVRPVPQSLAESLSYDFIALGNESPWTVPAALTQISVDNGAISGGLRPEGGNGTFKAVGSGTYGHTQSSKFAFEAQGGASTISALRDDALYWIVNYADANNHIEVSNSQGSSGIDFTAYFTQYGRTTTTLLANIPDGDFQSINEIEVTSTWSGNTVTLTLFLGGVEYGTADQLHYTDAGAPGFGTTWDGNGSQIRDTTINSVETASLDWQLAEGIYVSRKYDMFVASPRTAELGLDSAYFWAHPDDLYRRVITLGSGAWPYKFELIDGPPGATIGEFPLIDGTSNLMYVPDNYGVVEWTPTAGDEGLSFDFHVRVFDQDYSRNGNPSTPIDIQWSVTVQESKFVWLDANAVTDGVGTKASPYNNWMSFWVSDTDATHQGQIARIVGGDFGIVNQDFSVEKIYKPVAYIANPGEDPILRKFRFTWTGGDDGCSDAYFQGITMDEAYESSTAWYFNWTFSQQRRMVFFENNYKRLGPGPDPSGGFGDNPSAFLLNRVEAGTDKSYEYLCFVKNTYDDFGPNNSTSQNGPTSWTSYHTNFCVFEHEVMTNMNGWDQAFRFKGRARNCTLRNLYFPDSTGDYTGIDDKLEADYNLVGDNEMAYCRGNRLIWNKWSGATDPSGQDYNLSKPIWGYRNNIFVDIRIFGSWGESQTVYHSEYNVCPDNEQHVAASSGNVVGDIEGATFDGSGYLDGTLQDHWRAERGADVTTTTYAGSRPADLALTESIFHDFMAMANEDPWLPGAAFDSLDPGNGKINGGLRAQDSTTFRVVSTAAFGSDQGAEGLFDAVDGNSTVGALRDDKIHLLLHYIDGDNYIEVLNSQGSTGIDFHVTFRQYGVEDIVLIANVADGDFPGDFTIGAFTTWAGDDVTVDLHVEGTSRGTVTRENWNKQGVPGVGLTWDTDGIQCENVTWSST